MVVATAVVMVHANLVTDFIVLILVLVLLLIMLPAVNVAGGGVAVVAVIIVVFFCHRCTRGSDWGCRCGYGYACGC